MKSNVEQTEQRGASGFAESRRRHTGGQWLSFGIAGSFLTFVVLLPLAAVVAKSTQQSGHDFWFAITNPMGLAALKLTLAMSVGVAIINAITGTAIAWVLVRDSFPGKSIINMLIDLPFALPTIVASLTLLALYGPKGPPHINIAFTRWSIFAALLFVTLPFVVRAVQPVLLEFDREMEEASASLGASPLITFRRVILPNILPAVLTGTALSLAKAVGEFGSVILISGNVPFKTQVASVYIFTQIENDNPAGAAAVSVVLLGIAVLMLALIAFLQRRYGAGAH